MGTTGDVCRAPSVFRDDLMQPTEHGRTGDGTLEKGLGDTAAKVESAHLEKLNSKI